MYTDIHIHTSTVHPEQNVGTHTYIHMHVLNLLIVVVVYLVTVAGQQSL